MTDLVRRHAAMALGALGGLAALGPGRVALAAALERTPIQTLGPFYPLVRPLDEDADLTLVKGQPGRAQGQVVHVVGRVLNRNGEPVRDATLEVWQANSRGRYAHPGDINPAPLDPAFQGFARLRTDAEGRYRFKTIKPGAYPVNPMNPRVVRTPHIHFDVAGKIDRIVTQMYFPGEALNDTDLVLQRVGAGRRDSVVATLLAALPDVAEGELAYGWEIVLNDG